MVQIALKDGQISMGHARAIINLPDDESKLIVLKKIIENGLSVRQVEEINREFTKPKRVKEEMNAYLKQLEETVNNTWRNALKPTLKTLAEMTTGRRKKRLRPGNRSKYPISGRVRDMIITVSAGIQPSSIRQRCHRMRMYGCSFMRWTVHLPFGSMVQK